MRKTPDQQPQGWGHLVPSYFERPEHQITIDLIGCGGTGSVLLTNLARMDTSLQALGHPGIFVRVFDGDEVSVANIGRQQFSPADLYQNKAVSAVNRINRFFGLNWLAIPEMYTADWIIHNRTSRTPDRANILVTCLDSAKTRMQLAACFDHFINESPGYDKKRGHSSFHNRTLSLHQHQRKTAFYPFLDQNMTAATLPLYWLDVGNSRNSGQVVLGAWEPMPQPMEKGNQKQTPGYCLPPEKHEKGNQWVARLPTIIDLFGDLTQYDTKKQQGPSCSLAEALLHQDLMINPTMANAAATMLWRLLRNKVLYEQGMFINLETLSMSGLSVLPSQHERIPALEKYQYRHTYAAPTEQPNQAA